MNPVSPAASPARSASPARHSRQAGANGLTIHYHEQGEGPPLVLLHGFPDHAGTWRPLADRLAGMFRVIAPDLRGYGQTTRPRALADYRLNLLVGDVVAFLDALGLPQVHLCGHDWGGVLAFAFAAQHPGRLASLVAINAPPADVLQEMIWHDPAQRAASQYLGRLRSPGADAIYAECNVETLIERFLGEPLRRGVLDDADIAAYRRAWTAPGVWQAMLAWYRAVPFDVPAVGAPIPANHGAMLAPGPISPPVLVIWGDLDTVFVPAMADAIARACDDCRVEHLAAAGHVPHRDEPDRCAAMIRDFLLLHPVLPAQKDVSHD